MLKTMRRAFPQTMPVMAGYLFLGIAFGAAMQSRGLPAWQSLLLSTAVYGGSLQFALVDSLCAAFAPLTVALLSALIQARHLFYGLSMLEAYRPLGRRRPYLVFALTDETYSLAVRGVPAGEDPGAWYTAISALDQLYWITGTLLGAVAGTLLPTGALRGIDFAMTALFTVILTDQTTDAAARFRKGEITLTELLFAPLLGGLATLLSLLTVGRGSFLLPAMGLILAGFSGRYALERKGAKAA